MHQSYNVSMRMPTPHLPEQQHQPNSSNQPHVNYNGFDSRRPSLQSDAVVSKLENFEISKLRELHDSEEKLHKLLDENSEVKQLEVEREMQLVQNRSLADYNMKQGPNLSACKQRLAHLYKQLNEQSKQFEENKRNLESLSSQYNPDTIMALLQTSVAQSEERSEKTADSFMDGNIPVDDFLETYLKERTTLHVRRTKVDKLKELTRRR